MPTKKEGAVRKIRFSSTMHRDEAVSYFEAILRGLKQGSLQFKQGDSELSMELPLYVEVKVKASDKSGKGRIEFEIEWSHDDDSDLSISSG